MFHVISIPMLSNYLFPHRFKVAGWTLASVAFVAGILDTHSIIKLPRLLTWLPQGVSDWGVLQPGDSLRANHDLWAILFIIGGLLAACSKQRVEDEYIAKVRLESLLWAVYLYYALLLLCFLLFSEGAFFDVMMYALFAPLLFFLVRFHLVLRLAATKARYEE